MSDRFGHAKPVDDAGETLQALDCKNKTGKKWDLADVQMYSGTSWILGQIRARWTRLGGPSQPRRPRSAWADASGDIETLQGQLSAYKLFHFQTAGVCAQSAPALPLLTATTSCL